MNKSRRASSRDWPNIALHKMHRQVLSKPNTWHLWLADPSMSGKGQSSPLEFADLGDVTRQHGQAQQ